MDRRHFCVASSTSGAGVSIKNSVSKSGQENKRRREEGSERKEGVREKEKRKTSRYCEPLCRPSHHTRTSLEQCIRIHQALGLTGIVLASVANPIHTDLRLNPWMSWRCPQSSTVESATPNRPNSLRSCFGETVHLIERTMSTCSNAIREGGKRMGLTRKTTRQEN
jgi:hypothetical protein